MQMAVDLWNGLQAPYKIIDVYRHQDGLHWRTCSQSTIAIYELLVSLESPRQVSELFLTDVYQIFLGSYRSEPT